MLFGAVAQHLSNALHSGFAGADESSHFLNGLFISVYLKSHFLQNPIAQAVEYYLHYPKLSIGHWPPAYYGFLGLLFTVIAPTAKNAMLINLVVSSLTSAAVAAVLYRLSGLRAAIAGVALFACTPLVFESVNFFMIDQALSMATLAATLACLAYVEKQTWTRALLFAALLTLSILLKGNGWLLAFVPLYYLLLSNTWKVLRNPRIYLCLLLSAAVVVPWYVVTSQISADGFNYQPGLTYAFRALAANLETLVDNVSYSAPLLVYVAVRAAWRERQEKILHWRLVCACLSLVLATLTLQSLVPADLEDRYMLPALPAVMILATLGLARIFRLLRRASRHAALPFAVTGILALTLALPAIGHITQRAPKLAFQFQPLVQLAQQDGVAGISLIDGSAGAEGAYIAEAAMADPATTSYVVRSSKVFSESNFMGTRYQQRFSSTQQVLAELRRLGVGHVVITRNSRENVYPHSELLARALADAASPYTKVAERTYDAGRGISQLYSMNTPVPADFSAVRSLGTPAKANVITRY